MAIRLGPLLCFVTIRDASRLVAISQGEEKCRGEQHHNTVREFYENAITRAICAKNMRCAVLGHEAMVSFRPIVFRRVRNTWS